MTSEISRSDPKEARKEASKGAGAESVSAALSSSYEELQEEIQKLKISEREFQKILVWLKNEVAKWRVLIEQSREGIVILAEDGGVYEANQRFADMLGYPIMLYEPIAD